MASPAPLPRKPRKSDLAAIGSGGGAGGGGGGGGGLAPISGVGGRGGLGGGGAHGSILASLSEESRAQILKFIRFFQAKREALLAILDGDWNDALDTLHEEEYSREEVVQELQQLRNVVKGAVRSEHQTMVNMVVLLLKQVFEEAQEQGAALEMDMHAIEDANLLREVENLRLERQMAPPAHAEMKDVGASRAVKLLSIKDEHAELVREKGRLEGQNEAANARGQAMERTARDALHDKARLEEQVRELQRRLGERERQHEATAQAKDSDLRAANADLHEAKSALERRSELSADAAHAAVHEAERLRGRVRELEDDAAERLNQSKAVVQMRRMLQEKNAMVADLRRRLERYEPDTLQADDD